MFESDEREYSFFIIGAIRYLFILLGLVEFFFLFSHQEFVERRMAASRFWDVVR
jgi:hypothetical protein